MKALKLALSTTVASAIRPEVDLTLGAKYHDTELMTATYFELKKGKYAKVPSTYRNRELIINCGFASLFAGGELVYLSYNLTVIESEIMPACTTLDKIIEVEATLNGKKSVPRVWTSFVADSRITSGRFCMNEITHSIHF